ncbi:hypothetical protein AC1031_000956 [Aphanomyces cochlioides]|nr:hypothetical protein AC1031_000956 [Aphanomyces cochlioides]
MRRIFAREESPCALARSSSRRFWRSESCQRKAGTISRSNSSSWSSLRWTATTLRTMLELESAKLALQAPSLPTVAFIWPMESVGRGISVLSNRKLLGPRSWCSSPMYSSRTFFISQVESIIGNANLIPFVGIQNAKCAIVLPVATGMALTLSLLTLQAKARAAGHTSKRYVLWPRIDQKSCFKSMVTAGLQPIVIENKLEGDELRTDLEALEAAIERLGVENILCVMSTTSCFAPRGFDRVEDIAQLCLKHDIGHVINNAYGVQSSKCTHLVNQAFRVGRVDACIQSTDKNFLVPVGGSIICGPNAAFVQEIGKMYPGRASNAPLLDLFITMLHLGRDGYKSLLDERKALVPYFKEQLALAADACGERLLHTPHNDISFCITLANVIGEKQADAATFLGSMLFSRRVSGTRVVSTTDAKTIAGHAFQGFGAHANAYTGPYLTAACAIGMTKEVARHIHLHLY